MAEPDRGFTLVEVMLAFMVLSVGVLGLASAAALTTRMIAQGHRQTRAAVLAARRLEILRAGPCPAPGTGRETVDGYRLTWTVRSTPSGRAREVSLAITQPAGTRPRAHLFQTIIPCAA